MTLWWVANVVLIALVVPVLVVILESVRRPAFRIRRHADGIAEHSRSLPAGAERLQDLRRTRELVNETSVELERYGDALDRLAPGEPPHGGHRTDWSGPAPGEPPHGGHRTDWSNGER